ncbi:hypothetical protein NVV93_06105 [Pseudomonas sp. LS44]|uniref:hypothetical protein n=1 Tax=Pseudomonas sp. LS44 TaxID=1357074 RepID=UPI00215B554C|nr:hypothetical protein [Pseudomonas sp. LS44]UVE18959.1 hypothetical protein NVV93_06105 [Pseudomonas sp. LS44]
MSTLTIEGWCKPDNALRSQPMGQFHFEIGGSNHQRLEQAEERLQESGNKELTIDADLSELHLVPPDDCGPLSDCHFRVYLSTTEHRGQFHLVGHRASDGSLVYTNAVLIDQLS